MGTKTLKLLKEIRAEIAFGLAALFIGFAPTGFDKDPLIAAILVIAAAAAGVLGVHLRRKRDGRREALETTLEEAANELSSAKDRLTWLERSSSDSLESWVEALATSTGLNAEARVSLYGLVEDGWLRLARFSKNFEYMKSGRKIIPAGQGVIHKAYLKGEHAVPGFADYSQDPTKYYAEQRQLGVYKTVCEKFVMRSQSYVAIALQVGKERKFVIVFESTDPNGLDATQLGDVLHDDMKRAFAESAAMLV
jgi:hypothetical protein